MCVYSLVPLWRMWKEKLHEEWGFRSSCKRGRLEQEQWADLEPLNSFIHIHLGFRGEVGLSWMIR